VSICYCPASNILVVGWRGGNVVFYDINLRTKRKIYEIRVIKNLIAVAAHPIDSKIAITCCNEVIIYNTNMFRTTMIEKS